MWAAPRPVVPNERGNDLSLATAKFRWNATASTFSISLFTLIMSSVTLELYIHFLIKPLHTYEVTIL